MKLAILPKYLFLFWFGGSTYVTLEVLWRGYSHWTMLLLSGTVFIAIGLLNEVWEWSTSIIKQVAVGTVLATALEFITGCIVNLWLGWAVWDYSAMPLNLLGQICVPYILLWIPVSLAAIFLDDWLRYWMFGEEQPHYCLWRHEEG